MDRRTKCLLFRWLRPHHFVVLMASCTLLSFILGYAISVSLDKVHYLFPYISDTGTTQPASSYFGLFLNMASVFSAIVMYYRHGFLEKQNFLSTVRLHVLNDLSLLCGIISAFGIMVVANFQELSVLQLHLLGAFLTFVCGILYCWAQTYLSYVIIRERPSASLYTVIFRGILSFIATIGFLFTVIGAYVASNQAETRGIILDWTSEKKGYSAHLVSTFSEWIMGISFVIYFLTYFKEFRIIRPQLELAFMPQTLHLEVEEQIMTS